MQTTETEVNEIATAYAEGIKDGKKLKVDEFVKMIQNRICFDHIADGNCDHSACWTLSELKDKVQGFK